MSRCQPGQACLLYSWKKSSTEIGSYRYPGYRVTVVIVVMMVMVVIMSMMVMVVVILKWNLLLGPELLLWLWSSELL